MASDYVAEQQRAGALSGGLSGAMLGGKLGSVIPIPGATIAGAVIGLAGGAIAGGMSAGSDAERAQRMQRRHEKETRAAAKEAQKAAKTQQRVATEMSARAAKEGMISQVPATADDAFLAGATTIAGPGTPYDRSMSEIYGRPTVG